MNESRGRQTIVELAMSAALPGRAGGAPAGVIVPLLLTFLAGPLGLLWFLVQRGLRRPL